MKHELTQVLRTVLAGMNISAVAPEVELSDTADHGEYTSNIAMRLAKELKRPPMEIGQEIVQIFNLQVSNFQSRIQDQTTDGKDQIVSAIQDIESVEVVPPGFINFKISQAGLSTSANSVLTMKERYGTAPSANKEKIMVEFAHPNTHKAFHIGHLRNITTGETLVRLIESQGATVIRANYQGDVGMHIAKCLYGILQVQSTKFNVKSWKDAHPLPIKQRVEYLGEMYAAGSKAFEEDEAAKAKIKDYNFLIYAAAARLAVERGLPAITTDYLSFVKGDKSQVDEIYMLWKETRKWSLDYFGSIYKRVGTHYDRYYFESECLSGVDLAKEAVKKGVLKESDGAVIFDGKPYGLDTRVFINSLGLPTYEGKELALSTMETTEFGFLSHIIHVVGPEQASFFSVTFKAEELMGIQNGQQKHLMYGWVKLKHGKMSSRSGNVVLGEWLLDEAKQKIYNILLKSTTKDIELDLKTPKGKEVIEEISDRAAVSAVKYAFLKVAINQEIAFDFDESVSFDGDSGPYLLYTYARCKSVLGKAQISPPKADQPLADNFQYNVEERALARLIYLFPDVVADAARQYAPNTLCRYLFGLAQAFNLLYAKHKIMESDSRLQLTAATAQVLQNGLYLLGIQTVERM
jgi:arginyl-tRNA synthetase